jgi:hypothetical protein
MGKHSGRHAFKEKLKELGYELGDNALQDAFKRFKALADRKKHVYDEDIEALVDDEIASRARPHQGRLADGDRRHPGPQSATLTLDIDGKHVTEQATGNGPVDAIFNAIKRWSRTRPSWSSIRCTRSPRAPTRRRKSRCGSPTPMRHPLFAQHFAQGRVHRHLPQGRLRGRPGSGEDQPGRIGRRRIRWQCVAGRRGRHGRGRGDGRHPRAHAESRQRHIASPARRKANRSETRAPETRNAGCRGAAGGSCRAGFRSPASE